MSWYLSLHRNVMLKKGTSYETPQTVISCTFFTGFEVFSFLQYKIYAKRIRDLSVVINVFDKTYR